MKNLKEKEVKKIQEETKKQILEMVDGWVRNSWNGFNEAKTDESRKWCEAQYNAYSQISLAINFLKIK